MSGVIDRAYGLLQDCYRLGIGLLCRVSPGAGSAITRAIDNWMAPLRLACYTIRIRAQARRAVNRARAGLLVFPAPGALPCISVVILGGRTPESALLCLAAVAEAEPEGPYEVILVCERPEGKEGQALERVSNLRVLHGPVDCSRASQIALGVQAAQGRIVAVLDQDCIPKTRCLDAMLECLKSQREAGVVGAKIVARSGRVWGAGGVVWRDGSGETYGRLLRADSPEVNYRREVDFVSSVACMIRRDVWEHLDGREVAPPSAGCGDQDLAFRVRRAGFKVLYEPRSEVVSLRAETPAVSPCCPGEEGRAWLVAHWGDVLAREHHPRGENLYAARDRSWGRRSILVIDYQVPHYDREAGGRSTMQYVQLFLDAGLNVKFLPSNLFRVEPYAGMLEGMGVELVCGPAVGPLGVDWLVRFGSCLDYVLINRPDEAATYLPVLRKYTKARVLYYGHDLHFVRMRRMYEMSGNPRELRESNRFRVLEPEVVRSVEVAFFPSEVEVEFLRRDVPGANVQLLPVYMYSGNPPGERPPFPPRRGLLFVGGYRHAPNADAVLWFTREVLPLLRGRLPGMVLYLIGQHPPPEIQALGSEHVRIIGHVSDEELIGYYDRCRLAVVPLRCGAGIKGKVVEALYHGVPVVTTDVGAEGLPRAGDVLLVGNTPEELAERVLRVYDCEPLWSAHSRKARAYVREHFSPESARRALQPYIPELALAGAGT